MQDIEGASNTSFHRDSCDTSFTTPYELSDLRSRRFRSKMRMAEQMSHNSSLSNNVSNAEENVNSLIDQWDRHRSRSRAAHSESVNVQRRGSIESARPLIYEIKPLKEIKREARSRFFPGNMSARSNSQESLGTNRDTMNAFHEDSPIKEEEFEGRDTYTGYRNSDGIESQKINTDENQDNGLPSTNEEEVGSIQEKMAALDEIQKSEFPIYSAQSIENIEKLDQKDYTKKIEQDSNRTVGDKTIQNGNMHIKHKKAKIPEHHNNEALSKKENPKNLPSKNVKKNILNHLAQSALEESTKNKEKTYLTVGKKEIRQEKTSGHQNSNIKVSDNIQMKKDFVRRKSGVASKPILTETATSTQESSDARLGRPKTASSKVVLTNNLLNDAAKERTNTLAVNTSCNESNDPFNASFDQVNMILTPGASKDKSDDLTTLVTHRNRNEISRTMTPSKNSRNQLESSANGSVNKAVKPKVFNKKFEEIEKETNLFAIAEAKKKTDGEQASKKKKAGHVENSPQIGLQKPHKLVNTKAVATSNTKVPNKKEHDSKKSANLGNKQSNSSNNFHLRPVSAKDAKTGSTTKSKVSASKPKIQTDSQQNSNTNSAIPSPRVSVMKNDTVKPANEDQTSHHTANLIQRLQKQIKEDTSELASIPEKASKKIDTNKINQKNKVTDVMSKACDY